MSLCKIEIRRASLATLPFGRKCRYHKVQGQGFQGQDLCPPGACPHLFNAAYPYALALLYDGAFAGTRARVRCPSADPGVELKISVRFTMPAALRALKRRAIRALQSLGIDAEYPDRDIVLEVGRVNGACPFGLQEGRTFLFNLHNRKELCPASFYAAYSGWIKNAVRLESTPAIMANQVHCPDPSGVCYETRDAVIECDDFDSGMIEVVGEQGSCPQGIRNGDRIAINAAVPGGMCPLAFHSIYPYYVTLTQGGVFEWVKRGDRVKVQCPKAAGIVMEAELLRRDAPGGGAIRVRVVKTLGECPRGHRPGDEFRVDHKEKKFCLKALAGLIPYKAIQGREAGAIACVGTRSYLTFKVDE